MNNSSGQDEYAEHPASEYLDFTFSSFGKPLIEQQNGRIIVPVRYLKIYSGFPGYEAGVIVVEGNLIFERVVNSVREVSEIDQELTAASGKTHYRASYRINDGPFPLVSDSPFCFYIGGLTDDPPGWIEWDIDVVDVKVEALETKLLADT
jgi:hypothetical protein